ncbi:hypothetical protein CI109_101359 [Kwoniella shandongensis]|uniref:Aminotransferase class I/classII large domain-containing protein n=1 Tax=Kwoniella shandongensis TaxID=1734106 RepID=A0AAJ8LFQ3_9TREE
MSSASSSTSLPKAIDLTHHLSLTARSRQPSPLKDIIHYMSLPGMISLAGDVPLHPSSSTPYALAPLMQYSASPGHQALRDFAMELTAKLHKPAYSDYTTLLNNGSTDGWNKLTTLLLERGDYILVEEQIYPSAQAAFVPLGCKGEVVGVDGEGVVPELLEAALVNWDEKKGRRPHVIYLVPVGQNPLGSTMRRERRKAVYDICVKYAPAHVDVDAFVESMEKSFMSLDYQGRVIRMETFSKTIAPGSRLGWFTCNSVFAERLLRGTEVQTQHPSGFSQVSSEYIFSADSPGNHRSVAPPVGNQRIFGMGHQPEGAIPSAQGLDATHFDLVPADQTDIPGALGVVAFAKNDRSKPLLSFVPPRGGMFLWCNVHYSSNPAFIKLAETSDDPESDYERTFWQTLADDLVLVTPGWYYQPWMGDEFRSTKSREGKPGMGHFRLAFSYEGKADMEEGIKRLADVMHREWA